MQTPQLPYHIDSPGVKIISKHFVDKVPILIEGATFQANLLILDKLGLDVILGMNWLGKHDGVIKCDRRMSPDLPRGTVNLIGGELDVDKLRLRTNRTS
jgi:hypothetical protein